MRRKSLIILCVFILIYSALFIYIAIDSNRIHNTGTISLKVDGKKKPLDGVEIILESIDRNSDVMDVKKSEIEKGEFSFSAGSDSGVRIKFIVPMDLYDGGKDINISAEYFTAYFIENKYLINDFNIEISITTKSNIVNASGYVKTEGDPRKYSLGHAEQIISFDDTIILGATGAYAFMPIERKWNGSPQSEL